MKFKFGWRKELSDFRDYHPGDQKIAPALQKLGLTAEAISQGKAPVPTVDLRRYCSPIEDQGSLGSCTANAAAGLIEYFEKFTYGRFINASRLFIYKATRNLQQETGDVGAYNRTTMQSLVLLGSCDEAYWPYNEEEYDTDPPAFCYALGSNYKTTRYLRLDPANTRVATVLTNAKAYIARKIPVMFGFTVYSSIWQSDSNGGKIPFPGRGEGILGGHAVAAVGYNDSMTITNSVTRETTTGAFLIRNSWGTGWGDQGYGWLPYQYVSQGLTADWWTLLSEAWIDTGVFASQ